MTLLVVGRFRTGGWLGGNRGRGRGRGGGGRRRRRRRLEAGDVAGVIDDVAPSGEALALAVLGEAFLVTAGELGHVRQPVHRARRHHFLRAPSTQSNRRLQTSTPAARAIIGPIPWGHSGPLCHALSSLLLLSWTSHAACAIAIAGVRLATPGDLQCNGGSQ